MGDELSAGSGSADTADLYNEMLRLEEMESLLEEIEELEESHDNALPAELRSRLTALGLADQHDLRRRVEQLHASLDTAE